MVEKTSDPQVALDNWRSSNPEAARLFTCVLALQAYVRKANAQIIFRLGTLNATPGHEYSVQNTQGNVMGFAQSPDTQTLVAFKSLLEIAEASPEFTAAKAELEPLMSAVAEFDAAEDTALRAKLHAEAALRVAEEEARQRALASVGDDPSVQEARKKLHEIIER